MRFFHEVGLIIHPKKQNNKTVKVKTLSGYGALMSCTHAYHGELERDRTDSSQPLSAQAKRSLTGLGLAACSVLRLVTW